MEVETTTGTTTVESVETSGSGFPEGKAASVVTESTGEDMGESGPMGSLSTFSEGGEEMEKGTMSPLTGSYLLIVLAEPYSEDDKEIIIERLATGKQ